MLYIRYLYISKAKLKLPNAATAAVAACLLATSYSGLFLLSLISPADVLTCSVLHMTGMVLVWPTQSLTCPLPTCRGARVPQMRLCRAAAASHEAHTRDRHRHRHLPSAGRQRHWPVQQNCSLLLAGQCCCMMPQVSGVTAHALHNWIAHLTLDQLAMLCMVEVVVTVFVHFIANAHQVAS